jgi:hypothetical protein
MADAGNQPEQQPGGVVQRYPLGTWLTAIGMLACVVIWVDQRYQSQNEAEIARLKSLNARERIARDLSSHERADKDLHKAQRERAERVDRRMRAQGQVLLTVHNNVVSVARDTNGSARRLPSSVDLDDLIGDE